MITEDRSLRHFHNRTEFLALCIHLSLTNRTHTLSLMPRGTSYGFTKQLWRAYHIHPKLQDSIVRTHISQEAHVTTPFKPLPSAAVFAACFNRRSRLLRHIPIKTTASGISFLRQSCPPTALNQPLLLQTACCKTICSEHLDLGAMLIIYNLPSGSECKSAVAFNSIPSPRGIAPHAKFDAYSSHTHSLHGTRLSYKRRLCYGSQTSPHSIACPLSFFLSSFPPSRLFNKCSSVMPCRSPVQSLSSHLQSAGIRQRETS